jgi:hypothetical protein
MPVILGANSASGGYTVKNSLRFNSGSSDYLNRTPASNGNLTTWTWSGWVKRTNLGSNQVLLYYLFYNSSGPINRQCAISFDTSDRLKISQYNSGVVGELITTAVYRDISAWYHIVAVWNTGSSTSTLNGTSSDRIQLWVNGTQITSFFSSTVPSQNLNSYINTNVAQTIGVVYDANGQLGYSTYANQYLSDCYFIDGQALTPSSFGQTDTTSGIWIPKAYTGSYGTNGFYLKFANSASLGTDSSGNGNNWTVNNLTSVYQTTDTPTNNFATINILTNNDTASFTSAEGNLSITNGNDMGATFGITKGKWYWESKKSNASSYQHWGVGFTNSWYSATQIVTGNGSGIWIRNDFSSGYNISNSGSNGFTNISSSSTGSSVANGDIIGIALDLDSATKSITFYQNGSSVASGTFSYDGTSSTCFPFIRNNSGGQSQWNFGNPPYSANSYTDGAGYGNFSYAVPSGYYALCTKNLAKYG